MTEQSPLIQRAVQRLHDNIARRETTFDLDAIKAVLVEMATQAERAERAEAERDDLARRIGYQSACLAARTIERDTLQTALDNERATSTHLETLLEEAQDEIKSLRCRLNPSDGTFGM